MSKRLQVVLEDAELAAIQRVAQARNQTVSEWVRQVLRTARASYPTADAARKIQIVREAVKNDYPTAGIDDMLQEIEGGYASGWFSSYLGARCLTHRRHVPAQSVVDPEL